MEDDVKELLDSLFEFFELTEENVEGDWPLIGVWSHDGFVSGPIPDDLYDILIQLRQIRSEHE